MVVDTTTGLSIHQIDGPTYDRIVRSGALDGQHVELLDGIIVDKPDYRIPDPVTGMMTQSPEHAAMIRRLRKHFAAPNAEGLLDAQSPLAIGDQRPEPDLTVLYELPARGQHPASAALVIEVAGSSKGVDRGKKSGLYATAGIPIYWIVDLLEATIEVRTAPVGASYQQSVLYRAGDTIPSPLPDVDPLPVAGLFA